MFKMTPITSLYIWFNLTRSREFESNSFPSSANKPAVTNFLLVYKKKLKKNT